MWTVLLYSVLAGVAGTSLGAFIGVVLGERGERVIMPVLSFTGGIMISIVCFELMPEAVEIIHEDMSHTASTLLIASAVVFGIALTSVLDMFSHRFSHHQQPLAENGQPKNTSLAGTGIIIMFAVSLHNFPEGMALGVVTHGTLLVISVLLALHNIPAGMSMALPLSAGGMKTRTIMLLTACAGAVTVFGALTGFLIGGLHPVVNVIILSISAGALLYVAFCEILPHAMRATKGHLPPLYALAGLLLGFIVTFLLHTH